MKRHLALAAYWTVVILGVLLLAVLALPAFAYDGVEGLINEALAGIRELRGKRS